MRRGEQALESGDDVTVASRRSGPVYSSEEHGVERPGTCIVAKVDEVVDAPHCLAEERSPARVGTGMVAAGERLDELEGDDRRRSRAPKELLAGVPVLVPGDRAALGLERGCQLGADATAAP